MSGRHLLVATIENYQFPKPLLKQIAAVATDRGAEIRKREITDDTLGCASEVEAFVPRSKYEWERSKLISTANSIAKSSAPDQSSLSQQSILKKSSVTLSDVEWSHSILFVSPTYHGMMPSRLRSLVRHLRSPYFNKIIVNKPLSAITYTSNGDSSGKDLVSNLFLQSMAIGAIPVSPPYTGHEAAGTDDHKLAYHHKVGEEIDLSILTSQVERLLKIADIFSSYG